jgi:phytoene synthase
VWPAFTDAVARYKIPHQYFFEMIEGVSSDLGPAGPDFRNCTTTVIVASVVGLTIIHIFDSTRPEAVALAGAA